MCPRAMLTLSLLAMMLSTAKTAPATAPNYIMDLFRCVREKTPLDCYRVDADSVKSIDGKGIRRITDTDTLLYTHLSLQLHV